MLDTKGNVRTWNAGAALLKGYTPEEIIGKHFSIFYGEDDLIAEKPRKELEICLRDGKVEDESWRVGIRGESPFLFPQFHDFLPRQCSKFPGEIYRALANSRVTFSLRKMAVDSGQTSRSRALREMASTLASVKSLVT
jgi:PAS domain-containing protein